MDAAIWIIAGFALWCYVSNKVFGRRWMCLFIVASVSLATMSRADDGVSNNRAIITYYNHGNMSGAISYSGGTVVYCVNPGGVAMSVAAQEHCLASLQNQIIIPLTDFGTYWAGSTIVGRRWQTSGVSAGDVATAMDYTTARVEWVKGQNYVTFTNDALGSTDVYFYRYTVQSGRFNLDAPMESGGNTHDGFGAGGSLGNSSLIGVHLELADMAIGIAATQPTTQPDDPPTSQPADAEWFTDAEARTFGGSGVFTESNLQNVRQNAEGFMSQPWIADVPAYRDQVEASGGGYYDGQTGEPWIQASSDFLELANLVWPDLQHSPDPLDPIGTALFDGDVTNIYAVFFKSFHDAVTNYGKIFTIIRVMVDFGIAWLTFMYVLRILAWGLGWKNPENIDVPIVDGEALARPGMG